MPPLQRQLNDEVLEHSEIVSEQREALKGEIPEPATVNRKSVRFGTVQIREFDRVVGDHPDCKVGPPVSLGWDFVQNTALPIDDYEADKPQRFLRRLSSITRKNLLHNVFGISEEEIRLAEKEIQKIIKSRERSKKQTSFGEKSEKATKSFRSKLRKAVFSDKFIKGLSSAAYGMVPVGQTVY